MADIDQIFNIVDTACGSHAGIIVTVYQQQESMKYIENNLENRDGFVIALLQIISSTATIRPECRLLSVILLKNVVNKRWLPRGGKLSPLPVAEKAAIKYYLLQNNSEQDKRIISQFSVLLAKVARYDWPDQWQDLFPTLFNHLQSSESKYIRYNSLVCLLDSISELSTKTLSFDKTSYASLCVDLFPLLSSSWRTLQMDFYGQLQALKQHSQTSSAPSSAGFVAHEIMYSIDFLTTAYKLLMKLLEQSFYDIHTSSHLPQHFTDIVQALQVYLTFMRDIRMVMYQQGIKLSSLIADSSSHAPSHVSLYGVDFIQVIISLQQLIRIVSMQAVNLLKQNPIDMVTYLESFLSFYIEQLYAECSTSQECQQRVDSSFVISAVSILAETLSCSVYTITVDQHHQTQVNDKLSMQISPVGNVAKMAHKLAKASKGIVPVNDDAIAMAALDIKTRIFQESTIHSLLELCLSHLLRLHDEELSCWRDDPEQFYLQQDGLRDTDTVKAAAEKLYLCLLDHNPSIIVTRLVTIISDYNRQYHVVSQASSQDEVEYWDAVYLCLGLGSSILGKHIDASDWLSNSLGNIINQALSSPLYGCGSDGQQILRHRFLWLLSCWMYYWDANVIGVIAHILVSIFDASSQSDLVVKLTSLQTLEALLRSERFESSFILSYLQRLIEALCQLVGEVDDSGTKARVIGLFAEISLSLKRDLYPILVPLVGYMGTIWASCDVMDPLRRSILEALTVIVREAKEASSSLNPTIMPLIHFAITGAESLRNSASSSSSIASHHDDTGDNDEQGSYLLGEGISLYLTLSRNLTAHHIDADNLLSASLYTLFKDHGCAGDLEIDNLKEVLMVVEAHMIVGQQQCISTCRDQMKMMYDKLLGQVSPRAVPYLMRPLEALSISCPMEASSFALQAGIIHMMLRACGAYIQGLEDHMKTYLESEIALVSYLSFIARIMLYDWNVLYAAAGDIINDMIIHNIVPAGTGADMYLRSVMKLMIDMFDMVGGCAAGMWRRKMWCLALLSIYPTSDHMILSCFAEVLNMVDSVLCEEMDDANNSAGNLPNKPSYAVEMASSMVAISTEDAAFVGEDMVEMDPIATIMGSLVMADVVNQSRLLVVTQEKIQEVRKMIGDVAAGELIQTLSPATRSRLLAN